MVDDVLVLVALVLMYFSIFAIALSFDVVNIAVFAGVDSAI